MSKVRPTTAVEALRARPWALMLTPWPYRAVGYVLTSIVVTLVLLPFSVVLVLLLPLWAILLGHLERRRVVLLGIPTIANGHVPLHWRDWRIWAGVRTGEATTWREVANVLTTIAFGILSAALLAAAAVALVIVPVGMAIEFTRASPEIQLGTWQWTVPAALAAVAPVFCVVVALVLLGYLAVLLSIAQARVADALLRPRQRELQRQVALLTISRMTLLEAFEAERRRIERNLHDGVQQQLVSLTMALAIAELDLDDLASRGAPVGEARASVANAHAQAEQALTDLRDTVRGIHPQALTKYGLEEALHELIGRAPIEVVEKLDIDRRLSPALEASAYFIVSELLTNAIKHSGAIQVELTVIDTGSLVEITLQDDGCGGASLAHGTGLRGLVERAKAHDGDFTLTSPPGGPTIARALLPIPSGEPYPKRSRAVSST